MLSVAEFRTRDQLAGIRETWDGLLNQTRDASCHQSYEFFCDAVDRDAGLQPRVMAVSIAGRMIGLFPLVVRTTESGVGRVRVLTQPQTPFGNGSGPLGGNSAATLLAVFKHIQHSRRDWDVIDLAIDSESIRRRSINAMRSAGLSFRETPLPDREVVNLSRNWHTYWRSRPESLKARFAQSERRLGAFGDLRFVRFRPQKNANPRWDLFSALLRATHHTAVSTREGMQDDPGEERKRFSRLHEFAARNGTADLCLLSLNGRPLAGAYSLCNAGRLENLRIGWAADATRDAVEVLIGHLLRDGFEQGDRVFRFLPGARSGDNNWATHRETATRLTHYASFKPRVQLLRLGRWFADRNRIHRESRLPRIDAAHAPQSQSKLRIAG